jgi:uroporphyrinogen decarboxylase
MAGVDMKEMKRRAGNRICLIGNVNCALMQTGTDDEVLASCRYAMENGKPGGGYIFSTSNVIFKGMKKERYDLMLGYYRGHCGY